MLCCGIGRLSNWLTPKMDSAPLSCAAASLLFEDKSPPSNLRSSNPCDIKSEDLKLYPPILANKVAVMCFPKSRV